MINYQLGLFHQGQNSPFWATTPTPTPSVSFSQGDFLSWNGQRYVVANIGQNIAANGPNALIATAIVVAPVPNHVANAPGPELQVPTGGWITSG